MLQKCHTVIYTVNHERIAKMLDQTNYETPVDGLTEINEIVAAGFKVDSTGEATADMKASFSEALHSKFRFQAQGSGLSRRSIGAE